MLTDLVLKHRVLLGSNSLHDVLSWHLTAIPQSLVAIVECQFMLNTFNRMKFSLFNNNTKYCQLFLVK